MILYKKSFVFKDISDFNDFVWFSLQPNYSDSYGNILSIYYLHDKVKLLDIGKANNRGILLELFKKKYPNSNLNPLNILDPDEQYSGGSGNKKAHQLIKNIIGDYFDGTIINDSYSDNELKGPTEVVLWKFNNLSKL